MRSLLLGLNLLPIVCVMCAYNAMMYGQEKWWVFLLAAAASAALPAKWRKKEKSDE